MKFTVAILLVIGALVSAEPPSFRARQTASVDAEGAPYAPRGWRPAGQPFALPQRSQQQQTYQAPAEAPQNFYGAPARQYGAPSQPARQYGQPEPITEAPTTTELDFEGITETPAEAENIRSADDKKSEKLQEQPNPAFFIIPQAERLVYAVPSAPLVTLPQSKIVTTANLQTLPWNGVQASIVSPYTASYVQFYQ